MNLFTKGNLFQLITISNIFLTYSLEDTFSVEFPSVNLAAEFAIISADFYSVSSCDDSDVKLPKDLNCYEFGKGSYDIEYMVAYNDVLEYIAVVYAGTFSVDDVLTDLDMDFMEYHLAPKEYIENNNNTMYIHKGMNEVLFESGIWNEVHHLVSRLIDIEKKAGYKIITTGHSLGGAESIITAVALGQALPDYNIQSLSYGAPKVGNEVWMKYVNSMDNVGIWRFVNDRDIIPRFPKGMYRHVGHTIQMNDCICKAYYLHYGNETLKLEGVPDSWDMSLPKFSELDDHSSSKYVEYLNDLSVTTPQQYFVYKFEGAKNIFDFLFFWRNDVDTCKGY